MKRVIESTLEKKGVISESPHQRTGGGYQTVRLGESVREGFRVDRPNLLKGFEIEGRAVCDLGANLGEISRDLRRAGASQVDAYEYDAFFTQIARYITAYNGLSDINHFQADVSEAGFLRGEYDVCVGLSAFSFIEKNIDYICEHGAETMIIETHEVGDQAWHHRYVEPVSRYFPHWCCFGRVSHSRQGAPKQRLWLAFSNRDLRRFYARRASEVLPTGEGVIEVDLERSTVPAVSGAERILDDCADPLSKSSLRLFAERLDEYERRFSAGEPINLAFSGEVYWLALLSGLAQFENDRGLAPSNVHVKWMTRGIAAGAGDPGLRPLLEDDSLLRKRVSRRLAMLDRCLSDRDLSQVPLPIAFNATPYHEAFDQFVAGAGPNQLRLKALAVNGTDELLCAPTLDGHHRLFLARLLGIDTYPMVTIWDPGLLTEPPSLMRVENYEQRMYQYIAGADVDDPIIGPPRS